MSNDPTNWTAVGTGIGALITGIGGGIATMLGMNKKNAGQAMVTAKQECTKEKVIGGLLDRMNTIEVETRHILQDVEEAKRENKNLRTMLHEMDKKLSEIHGMLSSRQKGREP